jgi:hypothetical protein
MEDVGILPWPPPDLVEIAEALDIIAQPQQGNRHARPTSLPDGETTQQGEIMRHDKPETMCSLEWLAHERRKAWQEGYAAGWKDQECDFPKYTTDNPYKDTIE